MAGIAEMAPLQTNAGSYGCPEKVVLLRVDPDFDLDIDKLDTVEKQKGFSGISEFAQIIDDKNEYWFCLDFITLLDDAFNIPDESQFPQAHSVSKKIEMRPFVPKASNNDLGPWHLTVLDPAFKLNQ